MSDQDRDKTRPDLRPAVIDPAGGDKRRRGDSASPPQTCPNAAPPPSQNDAPPPSQNDAPPPPRLPSYIQPAELVRGSVHGDSRLRRLGLIASRPFRPADEVQTLAEHGRWVQHPVITGRRVAVMGVRGGSGKSTIAALIALAYARHRQDRVMALDLDPELGSLPLRLGVETGRSLADLARLNVDTASFEQIQPFLARSGDQLWALAGARGGVGGEAVHADLFRSVGVQLSRFFGVTIMDSGAGILTPLHLAVLAAAHAQVLVTPATAEGARSLGRVLDWMAESGFEGLRRRTLVAFTVHSPHMQRAVDVDKAAAILGAAGVATIKMDYDRHLAMGATLDHTRLAYATRVTTMAIAAEALRRAVSI